MNEQAHTAPSPTVSNGIPTDVKARLDRGRTDMQKQSAERRLCMKFQRGDSYFHLGKQGLQSVSSAQTLAGVPKPPHRIRVQINAIRPLIDGKVSAATQRVPSYEVLPSTTDSADIDAARLSEKVALFGYDKWDNRAATVEAVRLALTAGEAFAMPYFDAQVGPFVEIDGEQVGQGEIKVAVLNGNQVFWEPGIQFRNSRWWAVERPLPIDEVIGMPGFVDTGTEGDVNKGLVADAQAEDQNGRDVNSDRLVMVTEYYERPTKQEPYGRRIVIANGRVIVDFRHVNPQAPSQYEPYPLRDSEGRVLDEPVLHRLAWSENADGGRPLGLGWDLIDPQRILQDVWNRILEWKNRALNPRLLAPQGSNVARRSDEPGGVDYYQPVGNGNMPQWEPTPSGFIDPLFQILGKIQQDMREMSFDTELVAGSNVAARTVQAVIEQTQARWQTFLGDLARWHSRLMRHQLALVAAHYTEERILSIRGDFGPENIQGFLGAQLMNQRDVRVMPSSLEYLTRDQVVQRVMFYAQQQWISPSQAMTAINAGRADILIRSVELDIARVDRLIQAVRTGEIERMSSHVELGPDGQPIVGPDGQPVEVPEWMPRGEVDDTQVWRERLGDWMKTTDYEGLPDDRKLYAQRMLDGVKQAERDAQLRKQAEQASAAEAYGMMNASKPQTPTGNAAPVPQPDGPQMVTPTGLPAFKQPSEGLRDERE